MKVTFFYAALLATLFVVLRVRTIRLRRALKIAVGDAGNNKMLRAIREHSNFAEYVPLSLLMIYFVEASGGHALFIHSLGFSLFLARLSHAYGLSQETENFKYRVRGMPTTFAVIILCSGFLFFSYLYQFLKS